MVSNTASVVFTKDGHSLGPLPTNTVSITTEKAPISIELLQEATSSTPGASSYTISGTTYWLAPAQVYHVGRPVFVKITDLDSNLDSGVAETVQTTLVSNLPVDRETITAEEAGPNSGIYIGMINTSGKGSPPGDTLLAVNQESEVTAEYTDTFGTKVVAAAVLVDPYGILFDSSTGVPINGATISIVDASTGKPATVLGDDGSSAFPATITSGGTAVDSGKNVYNFTPGGYRFPFMLPGRYRLVVTGADGYAVPSTVETASIQTLPGAPFAINMGSRGEVFLVNPGPAIHIDIPADPVASNLWVTKVASKDAVAIGDFLQYEVTIENPNLVAPAKQVNLVDTLPLGFRYQAGSARLNASTRLDPTVLGNGRTLSFAIGDIPKETTVTLTYVTEVSSGAKLGSATNSAYAIYDRSQISNTARATVKVTEDFFRTSTFITGRVIDGTCDAPGEESEGLKNVRIYMEDGSYVLTDEEGKFHFEGVEPGTHVLQLDTQSLPRNYTPLPCEESSQFAGRSFSQFVDLQGGSLWDLRFYAAREETPSSEVALEMSARPIDGVAEFTIDISTQAVPLDNLRLSLMLPGNSEYVRGSSTLNNVQAADPDIMFGALTMRFAELGPNQQLQVGLKAKLDTVEGSNALPAKALLTFDTKAKNNIRTPVVETTFTHKESAELRSEEVKIYPRFPSFSADLQPNDRAMLMKLAEDLAGTEVTRIDIVGHTDNIPIAARSRHIYANNQELSEARAKSVAETLSELLSFNTDKLTLRGLGESMPVADNTTQTGRALNRRVEVYIVTETPLVTGSELQGVQLEDRKSVSVQGDPPPGESAAPDKDFMQTKQPPVIDNAWLAKTNDVEEILWPIAGFTPAAPSTSVMVKYRRENTIQLLLNGEKLNPVNFDGSKSAPGGNVIVAIWRGVDLREGVNQFEYESRDKNGQLVTSEAREIWYINEPERVEFIAEESTLIADGLTPPVLVIRLTDKFGNPVRTGLYGDFTVDTPFLPKLKESLLQDEAQQPANKGRYVTGYGGFAELVLEPTTQSGEVKVDVPTVDTQTVFTAWLKPAPRDWILVGFAEGTVGYNTFSGNQVSLEEAGIDKHFYDDGQVKFFAKGAIKGEWLLTMAYDSDKPNLDGDSLRQEIDPDTYYPLYGDGTKQGYEAASARDIYLKLERDQFYAMFGDMDTNLSQTELSRYSRSMNGIKSEMKGETFSYTLFAADTRQAFAKDEIRGDGTSGRYYLATDKLVINSEKVVIEVRDRFHSERILSSQKLSRHSDYDIDYDAGSLFFKEPIPSKDENFNPVFIVVHYETEDAADTSFNYGGRAAVKLLDKRVEIGASHIHEERGAGQGELYGADATIKLNERTTVKLEAATTETEFYREKKEADAYLAEVEHDGDKLKSMAYLREQQEGFGLGQQNGSETGTRKYGVEGSYNITHSLQSTGQVYHEDNLTTNAERDVVEVDGRYNAESYSLRTGLREARDSFSDGELQRSTQWLAGADLFTLNRKLKLSADYEQSLNGKDDNSDFPTLLTLGADYRITEKVTVFSAQEFSWGEKEKSEGTRAGIKLNPWGGADINTSLEREFNENGERVNAIFGLTQNWQMTERWSVDFSIDRSHTIKEPGNNRFNTNVPAAHGSDNDFTSLSAGATYRKEKWAWWNKLETRQADNEDKYGASTSVVVEPQDGVAFSAKALAFIAKSSSGTKKTDGNIRLGMAYRPAASRWIVLNRLDFYFENEDHGSNEYDNWRIVNNMHTNLRLNRRAQMSFYYGLKYTRDTYNGITYSGFTDLIAIEARYNINKRWDIGVHASMLHSWNSNNFDFSVGADIGYSPMTNTWVSLGYNLLGFEDEDFSDANYTAEGAYLRFRAKFDQQSVREAAEWINR